MATYGKTMSIGNDFIITMTKEIYFRTGSGKNWKTKPSTVEKETVSNKVYNNYVNSIPFFNNFGHGAYCRAHYGYTYAGYIPVSIVTVSPGQTEKHIVKFSFEIAR